MAQQWREPTTAVRRTVVWTLLSSPITQEHWQVVIGFDSLVHLLTQQVPSGLHLQCYRACAMPELVAFVLVVCVRSHSHLVSWASRLQLLSPFLDSNYAVSFGLYPRMLPSLASCSKLWSCRWPCRWLSQIVPSLLLANQIIVFVTPIIWSSICMWKFWLLIKLFVNYYYRSMNFSTNLVTCIQLLRMLVCVNLCCTFSVTV